MKAFNCLCIVYLFVEYRIGFLVFIRVVAGSAETDKNECNVATASDTFCESHQADCYDDDTDICSNRNTECDSDPSYMLIHCRKTCQVCRHDTLSQDAGFGKIPLDVSIQVLQVARQTNLYFESLNVPEYSLIECRDESKMCAFYAFQSQCTNEEYREYMEQHCVVTCQLCELVQARAFLQLLHQDLQQVYDENYQISVSTSRKASLSLLMTKLGMDPSLIFKLDDSNWVEELHSRLYAVIPSALLQLYPSMEGPIDDKDLALLSALYGFPPDTPREEVLTNSLVQYRSRGYIVSIMQDVDHLITRPIQLLVGFAIPNKDAIERLSQISPLLQMGSGSGYWAGMLRQNGVDVLAYDVHPPSLQDNENEFFDDAYIHDIQKGACVESMTNDLARKRTLLLIWPNDPDPIDNREFCQDDGCQGSQAVWDADCLKAYMQAGGQRVAFVGERAAHISGDSTDCGLSATRRFQQMLQDHFVLTDSISIPNWWLNQDDLSIWERQ